LQLPWQLQDSCSANNSLRKGGVNVVIVITGTAESGRNTVGNRLAETLGWEFVDAEKLCPPGTPPIPRNSNLPARADPPLLIETLSAAINRWIYEWRDVVISCPVLTGRDRRQLSTMSLVKIVRLEESDAAEQSSVFRRPARVALSGPSPLWHTSYEQEQNMLTVDSSQPVDEIIGDIEAVLTKRKAQPCART
jgi:gluconokinase